MSAPMGESTRSAFEFLDDRWLLGTGKSLLRRPPECPVRANTCPPANSHFHPYRILGGRPWSVQTPLDPFPCPVLTSQAVARSSLSSPRITTLSASSCNGRCNAFASSHGAPIQTFRSS